MILFNGFSSLRIAFDTTRHPSVGNELTSLRSDQTQHVLAGTVLSISIRVDEQCTSIIQEVIGPFDLAQWLVLHALSAGLVALRSRRPGRDHGMC